MSDEFSIIERYFQPLTQGRIEAENLKNDAAVLNIPDGKQLVVSSDTLVADVHFFADQSPEEIAKKALRSNLSDLNAMGAEPYCYQMCLTLPNRDEQWLGGFTAALAEDQKQYGLFLSGGDTTSTAGPLTISISIFGYVDNGAAISRSGAQDGDLIVLSNYVGDAYCGLQSIRREMEDVPQGCIDLYKIPEPPMALSSILAGHVNAALDISDGLLQDLGHIARASNLMATIDLDKVEFSKDVNLLLEGGHVNRQDLLNGGDDYQLIMAVAPDQFEAFKSTAAGKGVVLQAIGAFKSGGNSVILSDKNNNQIPIIKTGWQHF